MHARNQGEAFIDHSPKLSLWSYHDRDVAEVLSRLGCDVFGSLFQDDSEMRSLPSRNTAEALMQRLRGCRPVMLVPTCHAFARLEKEG